VVESLEKHDELSNKVAQRLEYFGQLRTKLEECQSNHSDTIMKSIPLRKLVTKLHLKLDLEESRGNKLLGFEHGKDKCGMVSKDLMLGLKSNAHVQPAEVDRSPCVSVETPRITVQKKESEPNPLSVKLRQRPSLLVQPRPVLREVSDPTKSDHSKHSFLRQPKSFQTYVQEDTLDDSVSSFNSKSTSIFDGPELVESQPIASKLMPTFVSEISPSVMSVPRPNSRPSTRKHLMPSTPVLKEPCSKPAKSMLRPPGKSGLNRATSTLARRTISSPPPTASEKNYMMPRTMKSRDIKNSIRRTTSSPPVSIDAPNILKENHEISKDTRGRTSEMRHIHEKTSLLRRKQKARLRSTPVTPQVAHIWGIEHRPMKIIVV
jgi:hypothetical protein